MRNRARQLLLATSGWAFESIESRRSHQVQSSVFKFTDADAYQEAIRASQVAVLTMAAGEFRAELVRIDFDRLWMQWGSDSLPRIARSTIDPGRAVVTFIADAKQPPTKVGGGDLATETI